MKLIFPLAAFVGSLALLLTSFSTTARSASATRACSIS